MPKRKWVIIMLVILTLLLPLVSCGQMADDKPDDRIVVRLAAPQNAYIEDFETNAYKLWLEEKTGLKLEMTWLPEKDAEAMVKLALSTGEDLPDAYIGFGSGEVFSNLNLQKYAEMGVIIPLDTYIEQHGVHMKSAFAELAEYNVKPLMALPDGHIYYMPGFSSSIITRYRQVMWVNQGWLNALDIPIPKTTAEFYEMLAAFKTKDPNGNGLHDEIPLAGTEAYYGKQVYDYLFNAFIYNNEKHSRLLLENGDVSFAPIQDEWRNALRYMRSMHQDGLLSPLSFTQDDQQMKQMANDPRDILGAFTSPGIAYTVQQNSPEIMDRYIGIGPLTGPDGVQLASVSIPLPKPNGVITSACKNPEEVFKLFDLMLSEEASLMGRYGEQGVDWNFAHSGDISIFGTPATIEIVNQLWNTPQNKHLKQICPYISRPKFSSGVTWDGTKTDGEYMNAQATMLYQGHEPAEFIGALIFTAEEEERISHIRKDVEAFVKESIADFITGKRDIEDDGDWAIYVEKFTDLGLDTLLKTAQTAVDRVR